MLINTLITFISIIFITGCISLPGINLNMEDTPGKFGGRDNLALNAEVESSLPRYQPGIYNHFPEEINDGRIGLHHGWVAATSETGHWIKIDLKKDMMIDLVRMMNFVDTGLLGVSSKKIKLNIIDSDLTVVFSKKLTLAQASSPKFIDVTFQVVKGRYIQLFIDSYHGTNGGGFAEVEIYGKDITASPIVTQVKRPKKIIQQPIPQTVLQPDTELLLPTGVDFGSYHAVVIGNNDYRYLPKLLTAVNDARVVAEVLKNSYQFKVTLLENATRYDILTAFGTMREQLTIKDNLLIYYAGHGWLDSDGDEGYWLPVDSNRNNRVSWVSNASITTVLKGLRAKHVLVVADSCFSGKLTRGLTIKKRKPGYLEHASRLRVRSVLASGGLEPVSDSGSNGHSVFAGAFIQTLQENTGVILGDQLFQRIFRPVKLNTDQTPEYSDIRKAGHEGGDFIFLRK